MTAAAKGMFVLLAGLTRAYGVYVIDNPKQSKGKKKGKADTVHEEVTEALWDRHLAGEIQLGIVPIRDDATAVFGVIDIDVYDLDHDALNKKIAKLKLPLILVRSKSGGAHLYAFFKPPATAEDVRELLVEWAAALGYGGVEVFPKQNRLLTVADTGNWINMPYCGGSESDRHAIVDGKPLSVTAFLELAEKKRFNIDKARRTTIEPPELLHEGPPCLVTLTMGGVPEGGRNTTVFNLGVYAKKRWPEDWQERMAELNQQFISPPLPEAELAQIVAHLERKPYSYTCRDKPLCNVCVKHECFKREHGIGPADAAEYFGFELKNVLRLNMDPAVYFADFNGQRVTFEAEDLNSQLAFRQLMINQVNEPFSQMSNKMWSQFIIALCAGAEIVEAPPETQVNAEIASWLEDYCIEQVPATDWSDVIDGQVLETEGRMFFRPHKWAAKVSKDHRSKMKLQEAYRALMSIGVASEDGEIDGRKYRLWSVPSFARAKKKKRTTDGM